MNFLPSSLESRDGLLCAQILIASIFTMYVFLLTHSSSIRWLVIMTGVALEESFQFCTVFSRILVIFHIMSIPYENMATVIL